jgi:hypothetical protein
MIKGFLVGLVVAIVLLGVHLFRHLGAFDEVRIDQTVTGPIYILYKERLGPYEKTAEAIDQVEKLARRKGLDCRRTFGEYLDRPGEVDEDRLRSRAGCVSDKPFPATADVGIADLKSDVIPAGHFVTAFFSGSPAIGPWKVYRKVQQYIFTNRLVETGETIEIYSLQDDAISTQYLFPLK